MTPLEVELKALMLASLAGDADTARCSIG